MYLIPLNQIESVDLVIHALRAASGEADCTVCPVRKVCMKQCQTLAEGIQRMVETQTLPRMDADAPETDQASSGEPQQDPPEGGGNGHLRVVK